MAGRRSPSSRSVSDNTCQILLQKLQRGQDQLHESLVHLQPTKKEKRCKPGARLRVTHVRYQPGGNNPLCCVKHLPVRRARTEQLSPNTHSPHVTRKHRKRLSSTPKHSPPPLPLSSPSTHHPLHGTDTSLENALFSYTTTTAEGEVGTRGRREVGTRGKREKGTNNHSKDRSGSRQSLKKGVRYNLRQESKGTSEERGGGRASITISSTVSNVDVNKPGSPSLSGVVRDSQSVRSRYETRQRKARGLTVSFVTNENLQPKRDQSDCGSHGAGSHKRKCGDISFTEEREKGERLTSSLNSSRYGALEHHRKSDQPCKKTRRVGHQRWAGDDPRLGYDWIAGLVEAGSALEDKDEEYFVEMREFRRVNHSECSRPNPLFLPDNEEGSTDGLSPPHPSLSSQSSHTHCTQSYVLNNRLFPIPHSSCSSGDGVCRKKCPVCEGRREGGEGKKPVRYIRVSVPRSCVQAPYQLRPHRRRSFDPSDSMALNKHCLAGWCSAKPPSLPPQPSVDLKSAITHTPQALQTHTAALSQPYTRSRQASGRSLSRDLLNTSHGVEYSLQSRNQRNV